MAKKTQVEKTARTRQTNKQVMKKFTEQDLTSHVNQFSREPFQELLVTLLLAAPNPQAMHEAANKSPDRYFQALTQAAKLAGFNETIQHNHLHVDLTQLSDSQLEEFIATHSTSLPAASVSLPTASQSLETLNAEPEVINVTPDKE